MTWFCESERRDWKEILAAYVRKSAIPSIVEVEAARVLPGTAEQRREAAEAAAKRFEDAQTNSNT